jgi:hypothetical protein
MCDEKGNIIVCSCRSLYEHTNRKINTDICRFVYPFVWFTFIAQKITTLRQKKRTSFVNIYTFFSIDISISGLMRPKS